MVDGGFDYFRTGWNNRIAPKEPTYFKKFIKATKQDLYNDWNYREEKYGTIKPGNRTLVSVRKVHTLWLFGKEYTVLNRDLRLSKDYVLQDFGTRVLLKKDLDKRIDVKIPFCNKYVTLVTDLIIDYLYEEK